jgi:predicted XRE-type DNA-binding protein
MSEARSVFDDLFEPEEAENLKIRADLMRTIKRFIKEHGYTQQYAAEVMNVHQPHISDLMRGKIQRFSIDQLVNMAASIGLKVKIEFSIPDAA